MLALNHRTPPWPCSCGAPPSQHSRAKRLHRWWERHGLRFSITATAVTNSPMALGGRSERRPTPVRRHRKMVHRRLSWSVSGSEHTIFEFEWPWTFLLLPLPLLVWWLMPAYRDQQTSVHVPFFDRLAEATGQTPQPGAVVLPRRVIQMIVAMIIWALIVVALARPLQVGDPVTHEISTRDLILVVDISGSMDEVDFRTPDGQTIKRLDGVKRVLGDFITRRRGDRVALILFGSKAYIQAPFTQDLQTARALLDQTEVGMAGQQTVIGDAIGLAIKTFETSQAKQKLVILFTDGNDTASRVPPEHAADIARQKGVVIYTVGFGDPNATGENRVDLSTLRQVASATAGQFFRAEDGAQLATIYGEIDRLAPVKLETLTWRPRDPLYQWPLGAAVILGLALWCLLLTGSIFRWRGSRHA